MLIKVNKDDRQEVELWEGSIFVSPDFFVSKLVHWISIGEIPDDIRETVLSTIQESFQCFCHVEVDFFVVYTSARDFRGGVFILATIAKVCQFIVWDMLRSRARKQESQKCEIWWWEKEKGGKREEESAERCFKAGSRRDNDEKQGFGGLGILEFCSLTMAATTHSPYDTNNNKHVSSQRHSHSLL